MIEGCKVGSAADLGAVVRETRLAAAMTQQQLADQVGTTRQWVIRLEQGDHSSTSSKVLAALTVLGLEMVARFDLPLRGAD
ncbi:helix-turn-helix domain-containing protein [Candidatus Poriferisodalis sp.]|uniref:helix-turn-helix domain-containing protein n=1 Tax=Candidatus Poriferisodalis sp. TaxID=3101277 RepID=UPI003C6FDB68